MTVEEKVLPTYLTLVTQIFLSSDPTVDTDATFTADRQMVGTIVRESGVARLRYDLPLVPGRARVPKPSVTTRRPTASEVAKRLVGTWQLVDLVRTNAEGSETHVFGKDPIGYLHYSDSGVVSAQLGCRGRRSAPSDTESLKKEFISYFGRYEVDVKRQVVRHLIEGEAVPGAHPPIVERRFRFDRDLLSLHPLEPSPQGEREVIWRRAGS